MNFHPTGIFVPLITPFDDTGAVAGAELERLAHSVIDSGASGIVALGTTAEAATLSPQERREVVRICDQVCRHHAVPLIVGAGTNDTAGTVHALEELTEDADVAGVLTVVPYYTRPSEAGVVAHFEFVADRSPAPLILYNVPYRTGRSLGCESVLHLSEHPRIIGIKQAVGSIDSDTARLIAASDDSFSVLAGEDALASPLLAMGAEGAILATANVCPAEFVELFRLWRDGDVTDARRLGNRLTEASHALMSTPNPTAIKAVLHDQCRIPTPHVRLPLLPVAPPPGVLDALGGLRAANPTRAH